MLSAMIGKGGVRTSPLVLAGLEGSDEQVYRRLLRLGAASRARLAEITGLPVGDLHEALERLALAGLVDLSADLVTAEGPSEVFGRLIRGETDRLRFEFDQLDQLRDMIPGLVLEQVAGRRTDRQDVADVLAVENVDVVQLVRSLIEESDGDLAWFQADQWRLPVAQEIDALVGEALRAGRRSRAIYPTRVLEEAPEALRARAEAGEQVRLVASLSTRIVVFGGSAALLPDRWAESSTRRLVVREQSLVAALAALFAQTWERGIPVPGLEGNVDDLAGERRLLLLQLTRGAKDEQIARALGTSLRTVRRRVADIMAELGAQSRFQAGVEAVRRGWI
jgi:DNA-binding NarL/FixJ family response regulator